MWATRLRPSTDPYRLDVAPSAGAAKAILDAAVSSSLPDGITDAQFGSSVAVTVQLKGDNPAGFPATIDAGPAKNGASYSVLLSYPNGTADRVTIQADETGAAAFDVILSDPDTRKDNTAAEGTVTYTISSIKNAGGVWAPDCDGGVTVDGDNPNGCVDGDSGDADDRDDNWDADDTDRGRRS